MSITSVQRKHLRSLAHHLDPVVIIGKQGAGDTLIQAVNDALDAHELIKVRFNDFKKDKERLLETIVGRTRCEIAGTVGHVAILFRRHEDPEQRKIELPD